MALTLKDRVKETTITTGTGTVTLAGAATGYQSFSAVGNANTTYYCIAGQTSAEWEVGIGTYTSSGTTLSRDTVLSSSNAGSLVSFSAGTKDVFVTYPSAKGVWLDASGNAIFAGVVQVADGTAAAPSLKFAAGGAQLGFSTYTGSTDPTYGYSNINISAGGLPVAQMGGYSDSGSHGEIVILGNGSSTYGGGFVLRHSRGTFASPTIVQNADSPGYIYWDGYDGTQYRGCAYIDCRVDGTPGAGDMPGMLRFATTADGSAGPTERMRIDSSGNVLVTSPAGLGYGTGSGGTVTQATSKSTSVTLNKPTGAVVMNNAALGAGASVSFQLNNSLLTYTDVVVANVIADVDHTAVVKYSTLGNVTITVTNQSGGSLSVALTVQFAIIKGVTA